jgi:hypothetical protein
MAALDDHCPIDKWMPIGGPRILSFEAKAERRGGRPFRQGKLTISTDCRRERYWMANVDLPLVEMCSFNWLRQENSRVMERRTAGVGNPAAKEAGRPIAADR